MKRALVVVAAGIFAALGLFVSRPSVAAATCTGSTISGSGTVLVPSGATCTLSFQTVPAAIQVQAGGSLSLSDVTVKGTISA
jgi:hypothetical protein